MNDAASPAPASTPAQLGFRMPAEWAPHRATWLTWPRRDGISFPDRYDAIPPVYVQIIRHLVAVEDVEINVWNDETEQEIRELLRREGVAQQRVHFHHFPAYEPWCRDHGPIFLLKNHGAREKAVVDWNYNAWGNKYPPYDLDDAVPQKIAQLRGAPLFSPGIVLEGGSIDVNGRGALLTTQSCLLNPNRNPHLSQKEISQCLRDFLGVDKVLWLNEGIVGDDTDGHIDDLARFISPHTVAVAFEEDPDDANFQLLQENWNMLRSFRDQDEKLLRLVKLPMPRLVEHQGQRLPASYANFYIANGVVLVPIFRQPADSRAIAILQKEFPNHKVIGIDCTDLIWGLGSIHCLTQQEPA